jgi:hypothetical protein
MGAVDSLAGVATCGEGGRGLEVHMNLMPPRVSKVSFFSPYFGPSGRLLIEGIRAFQIPFLLFKMKKDTYNDIFARGLLKTK